MPPVLVKEGWDPCANDNFTLRNFLLFMLNLKNRGLCLCIRTFYFFYYNCCSLLFPRNRTSSCVRLHLLFVLETTLYYILMLYIVIVVVCYFPRNRNIFLCMLHTCFSFWETTLYYILMLYIIIYCSGVWADPYWYRKKYTYLLGKLFSFIISRKENLCG